MQDDSIDADILPVSLVMFGINLECIQAGFIYFNLLEMCLVILNYGSWSIACGIKQGMSVCCPNMNGNVLEKLGAAWIGGNPI